LGGFWLDKQTSKASLAAAGKMASSDVVVVGQ
jgi:hypothetical protein